MFGTKRAILLGGSAKLALPVPALAWWTARKSSFFMLSSGNSITQWTDALNGYQLTQAFSSQRPVYNPTGFNGSPVVTFDGIDDCVELLGVPSNIPIGATPCEIWVREDQVALAADTTVRYAILWGGAGIQPAQARGVSRIVTGGVNRANAICGTGAGNGSAANANINLSNRHVVRAIITGTQVECDVDGNAGTPSSIVPGTVGTRIRVGASCTTTAGNFHSGGITDIVITPLITDPTQVAAMYAFLNAGI